jgi:hypothetical protein
LAFKPHANARRIVGSQQEARGSPPTPPRTAAAMAQARAKSAAESKDDATIPVEGDMGDAEGDGTDTADEEGADAEEGVAPGRAEGGEGSAGTPGVPPNGPEAVHTGGVSGWVARERGS